MAMARVSMVTAARLAAAASWAGELERAVDARGAAARSAREGASLGSAAAVRVAMVETPVPAMARAAAGMARATMEATAAATAREAMKVEERAVVARAAVAAEVRAVVAREAVAADSLARAVGDREVAAVGGVAAVARADLAAGADWAARRVARAGLG
jgi:hypothetical protein